MQLSEILERELAGYRNRTGRTELAILETGTIRGDGGVYHPNDGWSTSVFARHVRDHGGTLVSIDLDTSASHQFLTENGLIEYANLVVGYSVDVLAQMLAFAGSSSKPVYDVVLLDSANDGALILHEYLIARHMTRNGGLIIVDDVDPDSDSQLKGHQLVPWLSDKEIHHQIDRRSGVGYSTGVLIFTKEG